LHDQNGLMAGIADLVRQVSVSAFLQCLLVNIMFYQLFSHKVDSNVALSEFNLLFSVTELKSTPDDALNAVLGIEIGSEKYE